MRTAVVAIAKDEDRYIREWLDYHFRLGFDDAYVYCNDWRPSTVDSEDYSGTGHSLFLVEYDGMCRQIPAYNDFLLKFSGIYDWVAFIDIDEFIDIRCGLPLDQFLSRYRTFPQICVNWRLFGSSGIVSPNGDFSVINRFRRCARNLDHHVKQILNTGLISSIRGSHVMFANPHFTNAVSYDLAGQPVKLAYCENSLDQVHPMEIRHYITKSYEECRERRSRPRADIQETRDFRQFFDQYDINEVDSMELVYRNYGGIWL